MTTPFTDPPALLSTRRFTAEGSRLSLRPTAVLSSSPTAQQPVGSSAAAPLSARQVAVKICGVTSPADAQMAAAAGADMTLPGCRQIGMILWPKARRGLSYGVAREVSRAAQTEGARTVGVFVDEDAATILQACEETGVDFAQLHGEGARAALPQLPSWLPVIYVMHMTPGGVQITPSPVKAAAAAGQELSRPVEWVLLDGEQGGSGQAFDWQRLKQPEGVAERGWILAGGLKPENVAEAVRLTRPNVVDVSSGVTLSCKLRKDPEKVAAFIRAVKGV